MTAGTSSRRTNSSGQLGNNNTAWTSRVPSSVSRSGMLGGKTVVAIAVGRDSLALCSNGTTVAWGANYYGQPGNNYTTSNNVPVVVTSSGVLSGKTVVAIAAGDAHSYAMCSDGALAACG